MTTKAKQITPEAQNLSGHFDQLAVMQPIHINISMCRQEHGPPDCDVGMRTGRVEGPHT